MTHENQVEATATLNDTGAVVGVGGSWTKVLKYDSFGRLAEGIDARGVTTTFAEYDALNRIKRVTFSDGTPQVTYTYDQARAGFYNNGALTRVETADGGTSRPDTPATATEFDYDQMGQVRKHRQWIGAQEYDLEYAFNLAGQLTSEKYPSGRTVSMSYDANGRLSGIADANRTYLSGVSYQGKGNSVNQITLGNGTTQALTLNDRLQMSSQELKRGSETLQKYDYGYGQIDAVTGNLDTTKNNGQLGQIESYIGTSKQWTKKFSYDQLGRLSEEEEYRGDNSALVYRNQYDHDRFGNMYRKQANNASALPYTPIEENVDISKQKNRFTTGTVYDDAGNVTQDTKFRSVNLSYDANGRVFKTSSTADARQSNAVYDAGGQRVATQVDGVWMFFVYDIGAKLVAEYGGIQSTDDGGAKYVLKDWQGSSRGIISNSGFAQSRTDFTAFGEEINSNVGLRTIGQGFGTAGGPTEKYALTERDKATGLDHSWFRKQESQAGRWTSPDPYNGSMDSSNPQNFNRYAYVGNDPVNFIDPSGLESTAPIQACSTGKTGSNGEIIYDGHVEGGKCVSDNTGPVTVYWSGGWDFGGGFGELNWGITVPHSDPGAGGAASGPIRSQTTLTPREVRSYLLNKQLTAQRKFEDCVRAARNSARARYLRGGGLAVLAGAFYGLAGATFKYFLSAGEAVTEAGATIFGITDKAVTYLKGGGLASLPDYLSGAYLTNAAISAGIESDRLFARDVAECEKQNPGAKNYLFNPRTYL